MEGKGFFEKVYRQYLYYVIIGVVSFITLVFLPMIGSDAELGFNLPKTPASWLVYIMTRLVVSTINVLIYDSFMKQAKLNVRDNEDYKKANEILKYVKEARVRQPMSPQKWLRKQYGSKAISLFVGSLLATFAISQAILSYNYMHLISYVLVITMSIVFGIIQMKQAEIYWTYEYYAYAIEYQKQYEQKMAELALIEEAKKKEEEEKVKVEEEQQCSIITEENTEI